VLISSPEQLIQVKTAGVQNFPKGWRTRFLVFPIKRIRRGTISVRSNNEPLFVVDGVPLLQEGKFFRRNE